MNRKTLKSVLKLVKPHSFFVALSALCAVFSVAAALLIPVFTGDAIDYMLGKGSVDFSGVLKKVITIAAVALAAALSQYFMSLCNNKITYFVCRDLRGKLGEKLHSLPISYIDSHSVGDLLSRMISDVDAFADGRASHGLYAAFYGRYHHRRDTCYYVCFEPEDCPCRLCADPSFSLCFKIHCNKDSQILHKAGLCKGRTDRAHKRAY